ncbi:MAG: AI-2E family transporter [Caldilineaceae bacterium]
MKKLALITLICLASIGLFLLVWQLSSVIAIFLVAVILATTVQGYVVLLVDHGVSKGTARWLVIIAMLVSIVGFVLLTGYVLGLRLPAALNDFRTMYGELRTLLMSGNGAQRALALRLPHPVRLDDILLGTDGSALLAILSGISSNLGTIVSNGVLVIFVAIYWVADRERIERLWLSLLSPSQRIQARNLIYEIETAIGIHLRSQIVQYLLLLVLLMAGYTLIGLKYPFLLAWIVSILWLMPLIGTFLSLIPALLIGLINGSALALVTVLYTLLVAVLVRTFVLRYPSLRQRPGSILELMVTIALIDVMGIVGLAVAAPVTVTARVLLANYLGGESTQPKETPQIQFQSMRDKLTLIQNRIDTDETALSPQTISMFNRLNQLVTTMDLKEVDYSNPAKPASQQATV